jgi:hypothetical protein
MLLACDIPEDEAHDPIGQLDSLLIDLNTDRGEISFGKYTFDVTPDQTCLTDGKATKHAFFCSVTVMAIIRSLQ